MRILLVALLLVFIGVATDTAQAPHPTVQLAADLLKAGRAADAIKQLGIRADADPSDCQAAGLLVVANLEVKDPEAANLWLRRLEGLPGCSAVLTTAKAFVTRAADMEALTLRLAEYVATGSVREAEELIATLEKRNNGSSHALRAGR